MTFDSPTTSLLLFYIAGTLVLILMVLIYFMSKK